MEVMGIILDGKTLRYILEGEPTGLVSRLDGGKGRDDMQVPGLWLEIWWTVMPCTEMRRSCLGRKAKKSSLGVLF